MFRHLCISLNGIDLSRSARRTARRVWRAVKSWESRSDTWLYPLFETPIWLSGIFGWIYVVLRVTLDSPIDARATNLGSILEAQAAMTAIFLAAMIFIVEAVHRREDVDDPLYEEFLSQSRARWVFSSAVWLTIATSALFLIGPVTGWWQEFASPRGDALGLFSLLMAAFVVLLFLFRALHVLRPSEYRRLRRKVTLDQVTRGAREFASGIGRVEGRLRNLGVLGEEESNANGAIDSLVEQTDKAVTEGKMVDILDGVKIIEQSCQIILNELDEAGVEWPEVGQGRDDEWPTHNSMLAGINRLTGAASFQPYGDAFAQIWESERLPEGSYSFSKYRLEDAVANGNELFAQILLECLLDQARSVDAIDDLPYSKLRSQVHEMFQRTADHLYMEVVRDSDNTRDTRLAIRLMYILHELTMEEIPLGYHDACRIMMEFLFDKVLVRYDPPRQVEHMKFRTLRLPNHMRALARQGALGLVGYAVVKKDYLALRSVYERLSNVEADLFDVEMLIHDSGVDYGRTERWLRHRWRLSLSAFGPIGPGAEPDDLESRDLELVALGYMWMLAMRRDVSEFPRSDIHVPNEYRGAWKKHGAKLVEALSHFEWSWSEANQWCANAFGEEHR